MGGNTALSYGAFSGQEGVIRVLLELKGDVRIANEDGLLPVDVAKTQMHQRIVRMLGDPDEAVAKARRERRDALAAVAGEKQTADLAAIKLKRRKESRHRRTVEEESRRLAEEKEQEKKEIRAKSQIMVPPDRAHPLQPLAHYPT